MAIMQTKQLGKIISAKRKSQRLTQEQLAAMCGVGVRFIRDLEKGKESCHLGKTIIVMNMLGIPLTINENDT
jgi:y4mF family transcriptional regulator